MVSTYSTCVRVLCGGRGADPPRLLLRTTRRFPWTPHVHVSLFCFRHVANEVLWEALKPGFHGIPQHWAQNATAVIIMTVAQVGFLVTGNLGTGIILRKKPNGNWSHPSACGLCGCGYGLLGGASVKNLIVFIKGEAGLDAVTSEHGLTIGGQAEATLGPFGRTVELDFNLSNRGAGTSYAVAFTKGAFLGVSAQGAVVGARLAANKTFYGVDVTPRQILLDDHAVSLPPESIEIMDQVYAKLIAITSGYEEAEEERPGDEND